jgi:thioesterase domain-containing protein
MKNVEDIWTLTPLQDVMLAHSLAEQKSQLLVEQFHCTIAGPLDASALKRSWEIVVARHSLLRAAPAWRGMKKPVQVVRREVDLPWTEFDWRDTPDEDSRGRQAALLVDDRRRGFDLAKAPLMRLHLVRLTQHEYLLVWTCHHLLLDGWCLGIVLREVFHCYDQFAQGQTPLLEPCGTFGDYLKWLAAQDPAVGDAFWRDQLRDLGLPLRLPVEEPRKKYQFTEDRQAHCELRLSEGDSHRLRQLGLACRVSGSAIVQAAWAILLSRHADREDVLFGVTVSGRPPQVPRVETIVGPFSNTLPLRIRVSRDDRLPELFERLHAQQTDLQPFEHCSLEQMARAAGRSDRRLFRSLVVFENYPLQGNDRWHAVGVTISDMHGTTTSNYPLALVALPNRELTLRVMYDAWEYEAETAARLLGQIATLLRGMIDRPDGRVCDLALVEPATQQSHVSYDDGGLRLRILDPVGQPAPVGMPADLWVEEANPSGALRLRKTGYRASWQSNGTIEYLGPAARRGAIDCPSAAGTNATAAVQVGGYSVDPTEVGAVLALDPRVERAAIVGYADGDGDTHLAAYVVPSQKSSIVIAAGQDALLLGELRRFLEDRLPEPMVPTAWRAVDALPVDASGRLDIASLPAPVRPRHAMQHGYVAPRDELEARVAAIWCEALGVEAIGVIDGFLELGGYSSLAVSLLARIEHEFGRRLPLAAMLEEPTVAHLAQLLRAAPDTSGNNFLVPIRACGTRLPLFFIHPAGGTVFCYLELAGYLAADVPLYGLQAQGVDGVVAPHDTIEAMAAHYVGAIKTVQPTGPYRVCGWSTGGVIAFEIARQLLADQDDVSFVALLDAAIPGPDQNLGESDLVPMLAMMFPGEDPVRLREMRDQPIAEQVEYFRHRAEAARLLVAGSGARGARAVYDVFEANMKAVVGYQPQPLAAPLTLVCASQPASPMHADQLLGWGPWAAGGTETHVVPGRHLTMLQPPAVAHLAAILDRCLLATEEHSVATEMICSGAPSGA